MAKVDPSFLAGHHERVKSQLALNEVQATQSFLTMYRNYVKHISSEALRRHLIDFNTQLAPEFRWAKTGQPLTEAERQKAEGCAQILNEEIRELHAIRAAAVDEHDRTHGNRSVSAWPKTKGIGWYTLSIHLHLTELAHAWKCSVMRRSNDRIEIDTEAEKNGITSIQFASATDSEAFVEYFELGGFVISQSHIVDPPGVQLQLRNSFKPGAARHFLTELRAALEELAVITQERERAISVDNGRVGIFTIDHFHSREKIQIQRITAARHDLIRSEWLTPSG